MTQHKLSASDRAAAKAAGDPDPPHPADAMADPGHVEWEWGKNRPPRHEDRYGKPLAASFAEADERLADPQGVSRSSGKAKRGKPKRYRAGCETLSVDAALGQSAIEALWAGGGSTERENRIGLVKETLDAIKPRDPVEGMLAVQLIGAHGAAVEAYRRAMITTQPFAIQTECLHQAAKASRTYVTLLEALDRHRGKGSKQRVEVRHVTVNAGGQAIVGAVTRGGGRGRKEIQRQPHALGHSPQPSLQCQDPIPEPLPRTGDDEREVPDARRHEPRRADG